MSERKGVRKKKINEFLATRSFTFSYLILKLTHLVIILAQFM